MSTELKGLPTATGKAEGHGALLDTGQGQAFGMVASFKGKILVTSMTNPGMMRQIKEAVGVACERGGRTCHAALVCNELRKPCVVGVSGLMQAFHSHPKPARIMVDGEKGVVKFTDFVLVEED